MTIPTGFGQFAGKENLMESFNNWLIENIGGGHVGSPPLPSGKDFFWAFDFPIQPQQTPAVTTTERGLFNLGELAFNKLIGHRPDGEPVFGTKNQTLIEITCIDQDTETKTNSTKVVRNLRDRVTQALATLNIPLRDYANHPSNPPKIGIITLDPESNAINEKFVVDPQNLQVKRYVIIIRVFWMELNHTFKTQTILSDAEIT